MPDRGTRLSETWVPTDKDIAYAESLSMTQDQIRLEAEKFRDYWTALPGQRACKLNWEATWRNWVRKDYATRQKRSQAFQAARPTPETDRALQDIAAVAKKPWGRYRYPRDVLERCVDAELLTRDEMEEAL